jgi:hypothetical protein
MAYRTLRLILPATLLALAAASQGCGRTRGKQDVWQYIVIHHSATPGGNAAVFDHYHLRRGFGGLAYHFVIGNGCGSPDGAVETGFRWSRQLSGTACSSGAGQTNRYGIAICLVGNLDRTPPTPAQLRSLKALVTTLRRQYQIPIGRVLGHREVRWDDDPTIFENTRCPGRFLDLAAFRAGLRPG